MTTRSGLKIHLNISQKKCLFKACEICFLYEKKIEFIATIRKIFAFVIKTELMIAPPRILTFISKFIRLYLCYCIKEVLNFILSYSKMIFKGYFVI